MTTTKSYFQSKKIHSLTAIGYWHSIFEPEFPDPAWFRDEEWNVAEKQMVITHLLQSHPLADWTGQSWCRFRCAETQLGSKDLTDGTYIFPEGLVHYLQNHHIRLPEKFIQHVQQYKHIQINFGLEQCVIEFNWWTNQKGWNRNQQSFLAPNDELIENYKH
ncbi:hypothetical protein GXP67_03095 [Rhodocytophaga rosea]|uniref:Uncharacterized protein n=1 Tax=Rhodocytophaga rosea TaxID=2704465 RepID=A0A6C0GD31_9BACT|nr:hypothetical protein [Rhodocytophaga rosea]QHT65723.1 hypothetical protein GXP67_03095 [Rhodocytophaga rosea]